MSNPSIEPGIQEVILEALPADGHKALEVMAQLSANMILSIPGSDLDSFIERVRWQYTAYRNMQ